MHCTAKLSEELNKTCPAKNTTAQLSTTYADQERHVAQPHRVA